MTQLAIDGGQPIRTKPWPKWPVFDDSDVARMAEVLKSGVWGMGGNSIGEFEAKFADYCGSKHGITVTSGTTALEIALQAGGAGPGDEVIVPAYTFVATATAVLRVGAVPVFADIDPIHYNLCPRSAEAAISPRTKAIIPVHFSGDRARMEEFAAIAKRHNLFLIEDGAHAHGAHYRGPMKGINPMGLGTCFSFQSSKNLSAGEGGFILSDDDDFARRCRSLATLGRSMKNTVWYGHHLPGTNGRITEYQAALLLGQLERLEEQSQRRHDNGTYLTEALRTVAGLEACGSGPETVRHSYHLFMMRYNAEEFGGLHRDEFSKRMNAEGIPTFNCYPVPLYKQPLFSGENVDDPLPTPALHREQVDYHNMPCPATQRACDSESLMMAQQTLLGDHGDMDDFVAAAVKIQENASK